MKRCMIIVSIVCLIMINSAGCSRINQTSTSPDATSTNDNKNENKVSIPDIANSSTDEAVTAATDANSKTVTAAADLPVNNGTGIRPTKSTTATIKQAPTTIMSVTTTSTTKPKPAATTTIKHTATTTVDDGNPWTYPYDLNAIYADCKTKVESYGVTWDNSLRPDTMGVSWDNPECTGYYTSHPKDPTLKKFVFGDIDYYCNGVETPKPRYLRVWFEPYTKYPGDYYIYYLEVYA